MDDWNTALHVRLKYSTLVWNGQNTRVYFPDGIYTESWPHYDDLDYHLIAERCGYNLDLPRYTFEHEFAHCFLEEHFYDRPSRVLWAIAHNQTVADFVYEEITAQAFQAWLRANIRPIIGGVNWSQLKFHALRLLKPRVNSLGECNAMVC